MTALPTPQHALPALAPRHGLIVLIAAILGLAGGFAYQLTAPPSYVSQSQVLLAVSSSGSTTDRLQGSSYLTRVMPTYASSVESSLVLSPVIDQLGLHTTPGELRGELSVRVDPGTTLLTISGRSTSAKDAQKLVAAITSRFVAIAPGLVSPITPMSTPSPTATTSSVVTKKHKPKPSPSASSTPSPSSGSASTGQATPASIRLTVIDPATLPASPTSPLLALSLAIGLLAGVVVGIVLALLALLLDRRVRTEAAVERIAGAPVIGRLPKIAANRWATREADPVWAEAIRILRTALFNWGETARTVQFSSSTAGEGTTSVVVAVATSLARSGVQTTVLDADLRQPRLSNAFGVDVSPGLADILMGDVEVAAAARSAVALPNLVFIPAGETVYGGDLLASDALGAILEDLSLHSNIVLIDTPAVAGLSDAPVIAHFVSSIVLVVSLGSVSEHVLERTVERLTASGRKISGVVVTRVRRSALGI